MQENFVKTLDIGVEYLPLGRHTQAISDYKGRLDSALVAKGKGKATEQQEHWLQSEGFTLESPTGTGVNADKFSQWVFGPFTKWHSSHEYEQVAKFPSHYAIGWNRRQYGPVNKSRALEIKRMLDVDSLDTEAGDGYAYWLKPLPVFIASEGKHRVDLFREHNLDMIAKVWPTPIPSAAELELWKIWGTDSVWALRCKNPEFWKRGQSEFAPLPLPHLSVPLFTDYGVVVRRQRCLPWKVGSEALNSGGLFLKYKPHLWRSRILNAGYV